MRYVFHLCTTLQIRDSPFEGLVATVLFAHCRYIQKYSRGKVRGAKFCLHEIRIPTRLSIVPVLFAPILFIGLRRK